MIFAHLIQAASSLPTDVSSLESSISALERAISALESDASALEMSSVFWERWPLWISNVLVLLGVATELLIIRHQYRDDIEAWARTYFGILWSPNRPSIAKLLVDVGSVLLIAVGIMGELGIGIKIASINVTLRGKSAELRSNNAELRTKSDQLIGLLHKETEDERLARVELEDSVSWRRLSPGKRPAIAARLRSYGGQVAWLTYNMNDVEANDFGVDIAGTLKLAHWIPTEPEALMRLLKGPVNLGTNKLPRGVVVTSTSDSSSENAAKALVQELQNAGFDATSSPPVPLGTYPWQAIGQAVFRFNGGLLNNRPAVFVGVEPRPNGPQGDAKLRAEAKNR